MAINMKSYHSGAVALVNINCQLPARVKHMFSALQRLIIGKDGRGGGKRGSDLLDRLDSKQLEQLILNLADSDGSMPYSFTPDRFASAAAMNY